METPEVKFAPAIRITTQGYPPKAAGFSIIVNGKSIATFTYEQWVSAKDVFDNLSEC